MWTRRKRRRTADSRDSKIPAEFLTHQVDQQEEEENS
jgi:hypothetical protein